MILPVLATPGLCAYIWDQDSSACFVHGQCIHGGAHSRQLPAHAWLLCLGRLLIVRASAGHAVCATLNRWMCGTAMQNIPGSWHRCACTHMNLPDPVEQMPLQARPRCGVQALQFDVRVHASWPCPLQWCLIAAEGYDYCPCAAIYRRVSAVPVSLGTKGTTAPRYSKSTSTATCRPASRYELLVLHHS